MRVLDRVTGPSDLRSLTDGELDRLGAEIRDQLVETVSRTGGHLGPNLGVVELTLALHRTFDSPSDRIVFDTGHQAYVHKMVTGRAGAFDGLRSADGLSGYPSRAESVHDVVENSHASTALSYADGLAKAYALRGERRHVVAVIGDGALTGGMAWEALNNLAAGGGRGRRLVVVLNDNGRSYTPTVGGLADHLGGLRRQPGSGLFGDLGLRYTGPVDGHDRAALEAALGAARDAGDAVVVHVVTSKGHGYAPAESHAADRFHSPGPFDALTGAERPKGPTWTEVFSEEMVALGSERPDVVALTAAMLHPVGLHAFAERHPERTFDVGIAEQHAATCAAGLAMGGLHPVVAVYATFLNRAFDQVLMDVALHRCGVTFVLDRAGVTGDDGASHNGVWDMSVLQVVPGLRIAAPRDATRLRALLREAVQVEDAPTVVRFAKGAPPVDLDAVATAGGCDVLVRAGGQDVLLVAVGAMAETCVEVAERLVAQGVGVTVVDPRWVKPVDPALVGLAGEHRLVVSVEDNGVVGGCGSVLLQTLTTARVRTPVRLHGIPQEFLPHAKRAAILERVGLGARALARSIVEDMAALEAGALLPVR